MTPVQAARHVGLSHVEAKLVELGAPALLPAVVEKSWLARMFGRIVA